MAPVTPMPLPLTTSSATPSPEIARSSLEQEEVDDGKKRLAYTKQIFAQTLVNFLFSCTVSKFARP